MRFNRTNWTLSAAIMLLPFMQLGFSFYQSVQTLIFILMLSFTSPQNLFKNFISGGAFIVFVLMLLSLGFQAIPDISSEILKISRVYFCFLVLLTFLSKKPLDLHIDVPLQKTIFMVTLFLFTFSAIQFFSLKAGHSFYFPKDLYVANWETLGDDLAVTYSTVRPSATFGEPSYLGFIALSLYVVVILKFNKGQVKLLTSLLLWGSVLICSTLAGFLALSIISALYAYKKGISLKWLIVAPIVTLALLTVIGSVFDLLPDAITNRLSFSGEDQSSYTRLVMPFYLISYAFEHYPLGITTDLLTNIVGREAVIGTDNGLLMFLVNFGMTAVYAYGLIAIKLRKRPILAAYLIMAAMFNGTVFGLDKVAVMAIVIVFIGKEVMTSDKPKKISLPKNNISTVY